MPPFQLETIKAAPNLVSENLHQDYCGCPLEAVSYNLGVSSNWSIEPLSNTSSSTTPTKAPDAVFVAITTERKNVKEFGIFILDTRDLKPASQMSDLSAVIKSYNYIISQNSPNNAQHNFKFGTSQQVDRCWVPRLLNNIMCTGSPDPHVTEDRNVILPGNSIRFDFESLNRLSFGLEPIVKVPIIDTAHLCGQDVQRTLAFKRLVAWLNFSEDSSKCAGNDSNLTLTALLGLAIDTCCVKDLTVDEQERRDVLKAIVEANKACYWHPIE